MKKQFIADYFSFSKKERRGIIVVLVCIVLLLFIPFLFPYFIKKETVDADAFKKDIAALHSKQLSDSSNAFSSKHYDDDRYNAYDQPEEKRSYKIKGELFYFDPNTITATEWKRLGVRDKTVATIQNYLSKGGKFYKPEDLGKIWGFFPDEIERLTPYVQIQQPQQNYTESKPFESKPYEKPKRSPVDINSADTTAFIALPGIGSKLSQRIISFRDKLGGFYKIEQVGETFGLPDSVFQKIKTTLVLNTKTVNQININTATVDELKAHPYLRWNLANAIVQYRTQHGNFTTVADIKKIMLIDEVTFAKVAPYLKVN
jgi:competence protein ComEA